MLLYVPNKQPDLVHPCRPIFSTTMSTNRKYNVACLHARLSRQPIPSDTSSKAGHLSTQESLVMNSCVCKSRSRISQPIRREYPATSSHHLASHADTRLPCHAFARTLCQEKKKDQVANAQVAVMPRFTNTQKPRWRKHGQAASAPLSMQRARCTVAPHSTW